MEAEEILVKGARQHNLDVDELRLPKKKLVVFTGVSGSGKSSLAFDTLYAEGQRRYVESLSSYARQFLGQMEKPRYDHIKGLSPTIAIEQKSASKNPRSTVGTITEIHDYLRVLYARIGVQRCHLCGRLVESLSTDQVVARLRELRGRVLILAPLVTHRKGEHRKLLEEYLQRGFVRVRVDGEIHRLDALPKWDRRRKHTIEIVIDRVKTKKVSGGRLAEAVEAALAEGDGVLLAVSEDPEGGEGGELRLSQRRYCPHCDESFEELSPQTFSFNSPLGMCAECNGLGRTLEIDPDLVIGDENLSIDEGTILPWASIVARGSGLQYSILKGLEEHFGVALDTPWKKLPASQKALIFSGIGEERVPVKWEMKHGGGDFAFRYEGLLNMLQRRYRETKSTEMRRYYSKFMSDRLCPSCKGKRLKPGSRAVEIADMTLPQVVEMSVKEASAHFQGLQLEGTDALVAEEVLKEIQARVGFLESVGLGYLTLDRSGPSLSGGEAQRIRLASQLGAELSGVLYVLDEPSIGLHGRDNKRLIQTLLRLRDLGNSVLVVEHDRETIESADQVVDFGPGAGENGGHIVFQGTPRQLRRRKVLTGLYLADKMVIEIPKKRRVSSRAITIRGAAENNLKAVDVSIPLGTLTAVTGVSGAGKSSLITGILYPALKRALHSSSESVGKYERIDSLELIDKVIHIDQAPIGRTPRSNPATYTKVFDEIRTILSRSPTARVRGYKPGRFSFNVKGGRCEACSGDGVKRVEMHFLPDVFVTCEVCEGRRYNQSTLEVRYKGLNVSDILDLSVARALEVFGAYPKVTRILQTLVDVGLDYVKLGQPAPTLSGGEAQRVKLSRELAKKSTGDTLYVLDEPTTGLHFDDIKKLLGVLQRLVDSGNTVVVIEHNLDVIKCVDHLIDLGPEGGEEGGHVVCVGSPEEVAKHPTSYTGKFLAKVL